MLTLKLKRARHLNNVLQVIFVIAVSCCIASRCTPAMAQSLTAEYPADKTEWPNSTSCANSDRWLSKNHDGIRQMKPRFLVINFANGIGTGGNDQLLPNQPITKQLLNKKVNGFFDLIREATRYQPRFNPDAPSFIDPQLGKLVDLQDRNGHANSDAFPRGQLLTGTPGYRTVGYNRLFTLEFAKQLGVRSKDGSRFLALHELVDQGLIHDVIMIANQVDARTVNPPDQVTSNILEVAFTARAYTDDLKKIKGEFVKNGTSFEFQKNDMNRPKERDHNSMPWTGRSLRIYFLNVSRGPGCLLHSLAHDFEFRFNESRIYSPGSNLHGRSPHPYLQDVFRSYAGFDFRKRYGTSFDSLYAGGDDYSYEDADKDGVFDTLVTGDGERVQNYLAMGNCHYAPGSKKGYDYTPKIKVNSMIEAFAKQHARPQPISPQNWSHLKLDPSIDDDCGGKYLVYWMQNMPGLDNPCIDLRGNPMKNWWPFMYY